MEGQSIILIITMLLIQISYLLLLPNFLFQVGIITRLILRLRNCPSIVIMYRLYKLYKMYKLSNLYIKA